MTAVTFNDEVLNAEPEENLLALARRNRAHIWFLCDGRGLCRSCECRVLEGTEALSPPTDVEVESISYSRRLDGYRLACQAKVRGPELVKVISTAEQLRRKGMGVLAQTSVARAYENFASLTSNLFDSARELTFSIPSILSNAVPQFRVMPPTPSGIWKYVSDAGRIFHHVITGGGQESGKD